MADRGEDPAVGGEGPGSRGGGESVGRELSPGAADSAGRPGMAATPGKRREEPTPKDRTSGGEAAIKGSKPPRRRSRRGEDPGGGTCGEGPIPYVGGTRGGRGGERGP